MLLENPVSSREELSLVSLDGRRHRVAAALLPGREAAACGIPALHAHWTWGRRSAAGTAFVKGKGVQVAGGSSR